MKSLEKYFGGWELPGKLLLSTLDADRINRSYRRTSGTTPLSTGVLCFFFILEGNLELTLDKKRIRCEKEHHNYLHILPFNILYNAQAEPGLEGFLLAVSKKFMDEYLRNKCLFNLENMQDFQLNPARTADPCYIQYLTGILRSMREKFLAPEHFFCQELIVLKGVEFILELASILHYKRKDSPLPVLSRVDYLLKKLFPLLLENCREHHDVTFYAERLCITPQYLNKITRSRLGRLASSLIADALITEAVLLLQHPDMSIQQVAQALHFSDQSSFGKFFKKQTGQSPKKYRLAL